jgi:hypothetical protein
MQEEARYHREVEQRGAAAEFQGSTEGAAMKRAATFTILVGNYDCPARCPFCISKMTPAFGLDDDEYIEPNWDAFDRACQIAINKGARTVLFTSKGETTLFPVDVTRYLHRLSKWPFDNIELQTNGLWSDIEILNWLRVWKDMGLNTLAISMYHPGKEENLEVFKYPKGPHLEWKIEDAHSIGLSVRLSCVMLKDYVDDPPSVEAMINYARARDVFQLTLRNLGKPKNPVSKSVAKQVDKYRITKPKEKKIVDYIKKNGVLCDVLAHGAEVYEVAGQNVCITDCLTYSPGADEMRNLIFYPQGWLTTSWEFVQGGRIL